jgi:polysaccharide export outer membrane protein
MRFIAAVAIVSIALCVHTAAAQQSSNRERGFGESDYRLGPEDVIEVFVWHENDLGVPSEVVRPDGKISLPLIGEIQASGKTQAQLESEVAQKLRQYVSEPQVTVIVKEVHSAKVSVLGEVRKPGVYQIKEKATILDAIALAEGFTEYAKRAHVILIRASANGDEKHIELNVDDLVKRSKGDPIYVQPYDKIYVQ